jgi:hypothetical protein
MTVQATRFIALVTTVLISTGSLGCDSRQETSSEIGRFTFALDEASERRALRLELSGVEPAECMRAEKPIDDVPDWRENALDPAVHAQLVALLSDVDRFNAYRGDTERAQQSEIDMCSAWPSADAPCYVEELVVTGVGAPWRFSLQEEITLSEEGATLVAEFQRAHQACWE